MGLRLSNLKSHSPVNSTFLRIELMDIINQRSRDWYCKALYNLESQGNKKFIIKENDYGKDLPGSSIQTSCSVISFFTHLVLPRWKLENKSLATGSVFKNFAIIDYNSSSSNNKKYNNSNNKIKKDKNKIDYAIYEDNTLIYYVSMPGNRLLTIQRSEFTTKWRLYNIKNGMPYLDSEYNTDINLIPPLNYEAFYMPGMGMIMYNRDHIFIIKSSSIENYNDEKQKSISKTNKPKLKIYTFARHRISRDYIWDFYIGKMQINLSSLNGCEFVLYRHLTNSLALYIAIADLIKIIRSYLYRSYSDYVVELNNLLGFVIED